MRSEPEDVVRAFCDAWNAKDAATLANLFVEDADFVNVTGLHWTTRADFERAHAYGFQRIFPGSRLEMVDARSRMISDDVAVSWWPA
jgi:uncharacterized protein (TIGR02246 family)